MRSGLVLGGLAMALCGAASSASLCETEEKTHFGDPQNVVTVGGPTSAPASAAAGGCVQDMACAAHPNASWTKYIYPNIINSTAASPPGGGCTASICHDMPNKGLQLDADASEGGGEQAVLNNLIAYQLHSDVSGPYVVPCHPEQSLMMCNLNVSDDVQSNDANFKQYASSRYPCGDPMPKTGLTAMGPSPVNQPLSADEYDAIVGWILCGAPHN